MPLVLNMPVLHKLLNMIGLEYTRVVNMSRLNKVLCKLSSKRSRYLECLEF